MIPQDLQSLFKTLSEIWKPPFSYCSVKHSLCIQITQTDLCINLIPSLLIKYWVSAFFNPTICQPRSHLSARTAAAPDEQASSDA